MLLPISGGAPCVFSLQPHQEPCQYSCQLQIRLFLHEAALAVPGSGFQGGTGVRRLRPRAQQGQWTCSDWGAVYRCGSRGPCSLGTQSPVQKVPTLPPPSG